MFCQNCGNKLVDGAACTCVAKSTNGLPLESLEKSLEALESLSKGVRPAEGKISEKDTRTAKEVAVGVKEQVKGYGDHGEGDSEEEPKTKKNVEAAAKKGGFMPPDGDGDEDDEFEDPRKRRIEEEEEEGGEPEYKSAKGKKAKKSFADDLMENESVQKAVDVSDFLASVVDSLGEFNDSLRSDVNKSLRFASYQQDYNIGLAKALGEVANLLKGLTEKVETIGKAPAGIRKSDTAAAAIEKSFAGGNATNTETLTKSQMAMKLTQLWESGDKSVSPADILRAESEGYVKPELREKVGLEKQ